MNDAFKLLPWVLCGLCFFPCTLWNQFNLEERRNIAQKVGFEFWGSITSCLISYSILHLLYSVCVCVCLLPSFLFSCIHSLFPPLPTKSQCPTFIFSQSYTIIRRFLWRNLLLRHFFFITLNPFQSTWSHETDYRY